MKAWRVRRDLYCDNAVRSGIAVTEYYEIEREGEEYTERIPSPNYTALVYQNAVTSPPPIVTEGMAGGVGISHTRYSIPTSKVFVAPRPEKPGPRPVVPGPGQPPSRPPRPTPQPPIIPTEKPVTGSPGHPGKPDRPIPGQY